MDSKPKIGKWILIGLAAAVAVYAIWQSVLISLPTTMGKELSLEYQPGMSVEISLMDGDIEYFVTLAGREECQEFFDALAPVEISAAKQDDAQTLTWTVGRVYENGMSMSMFFVADDGRVSLNALYYALKNPGELEGVLSRAWEKYADRIQRKIDAGQSGDPDAD